MPGGRLFSEAMGVPLWMAQEDSLTPHVPWLSRVSNIVTSMASTYRTGEDAPVDGIYQFVEHIEDVPHCNPTPEEERIPLDAGETFPPHRSCEKGAVWKLYKRT